jgi:hypothetical protein
MRRGDDARAVRFAADRLVEVHGDSPNADFVHALRRAANRLAVEDAIPSAIGVIQTIAQWDTTAAAWLRDHEVDP